LQRSGREEAGLPAGVLYNVAAVVSEGGQDPPLIGAPILRLLQYRMAQDGCVLTLPLNAALPG